MTSGTGLTMMLESWCRSKRCKLRENLQYWTKLFIGIPASLVHVHVHDAFPLSRFMLCHQVHAAGPSPYWVPGPCCMSISMLHAEFQGVCLCRYCIFMSMSILHVLSHAVCPCPFPCCMSMGTSMLLVRVHNACPSPWCMSRSILHFHRHDTCPCPCWMPESMYCTFCISASMLHVHVHCMPISVIFVHVHAACLCPCNMSMSISLRIFKFPLSLTLSSSSFRLLVNSSAIITYSAI